MDLPDFLFPFKEGLIKFERPCLKIKPTVANKENYDDPLPLTASKLLGRPFIPLDEEYPLDRDGKPLVLAAQINFSELPELQHLPRSGLLQLFLSPTDWYDEGYAIKFVSDSSLFKKPQRDFSFITDSLYQQLPIGKIHSLTFEPTIDNGGSEDCQFDFKFDGLNFWDFEETLTDRERELLGQYFDASGHKIGGYGEFTQSDPRDYSSTNRSDFQLLQIDVDDHIMFGDAGLGHVFISPEALSVLDFEKVYFYWDCC